MAPQAARSKIALRRAALARRDELSAAERADRSAAIHRKAEPLMTALAPRCVSGFLPIGSECDPQPLMAALRDQGATIALPAFEDRQTIVFRSYDEAAPLVPAGFGTRQPPPSAPVVSPDTLLVPLVGFDRDSGRLGYGKGHYDRAIATMRASGAAPHLVGIAFAVQEVDPIPLEPHDIRLDWVVTDAEVLDFRGR